MALVLISHDHPSMRTICDRVAVMRAGELVETASSAELFANPQHPYQEAAARFRFPRWIRLDPEVALDDDEEAIRVEATHCQPAVWRLRLVQVQPSRSSAAALIENDCTEPAGIPRWSNVCGTPGEGE